MSHRHRVDVVVPGVVDTTTAEHEAVHAHAKVLSVRLETFPDEHAGSGDSRHLTRLRGNFVTIVGPWLTRQPGQWEGYQFT